MNRDEPRGVSFGTVLMLLVSCAVVAGFLFVLPKLMGPVDVLIGEITMRSTTNLNDALPEPEVGDIPIGNTTKEPVQVKAQTTPESVAPTAIVTATPAPTAAAPVLNASISLTFGGSICMDKLTRQSGYYADTEKYDYTENLSLIAQELDSDVTMLTLESITDPSGDRRQIPNAPHEAMDMLAAANVDVVCLGYNRAFERGISGVQATIDQAEERNLIPIGTSTQQQDADEVTIITVGQVDVAYLHYSNKMTDKAKRQFNSAGAVYAQPVVQVNDNGAEQIAADIRRARDQGADIVVVSLNWSGNDSISTTSTKMKRFMQTLADAGADVIVGAGTESVMGVNWLMGKRADGTSRQTLCAWSLGRLLNGARDNPDVRGMLLHLKLSWDGSAVSFESVTYTPTYTWRYMQDNYYRYRVVASDQPAPYGMDDSQAANAQKAFERLKDTLRDSPVNLRVK